MYISTQCMADLGQVNRESVYCVIFTGKNNEEISDYKISRYHN
jgi:cytochrome c-type biogenesis protein CcmH/NrfF